MVCVCSRSGLAFGRPSVTSGEIEGDVLLAAVVPAWRGEKRDKSRSFS